jgi:YHS domain-containing protein
MPEPSDLIRRIDAEISALETRRKQFQQQQVAHYHEREQRLETFEQLLDQLRGVWGPRLEALAKKFSDRVQVTPTVKPGNRQATFQFKSPVAQVCLRISAATDLEVTKLIVGYDLDILPILMQFDKHAEISFPLDRVDQEALAQWLDDRIVDFVKTYLALHENEHYLKDFMVEDPVARVRFPKFAAGAKLDRGGKTYYFVSDETCREFERQQG